MKRIIIFGLVMMIALTLSAQKDVTKFLGIPVDGSKSAMIEKLKAKGFTYNAVDDELSGEFNGKSVNISVVTNNNKVWRIVVYDAYPTRRGSEIRNRFNTLCQQFAKSDKYIPANIIGGFEIDENEDITMQISLYDKQYEAAYYQVNNTDMDTVAMQEWFQEKINSRYT